MCICHIPNSKFRGSKSGLNVKSYLSKNVLSLPMHPYLKKEEKIYISESINNFIKNKINYFFVFPWYYLIGCYISTQLSGRSSVVEHLVANENVESSNLFARSNSCVQLHISSWYVIIFCYLCLGGRPFQNIYNWQIIYYFSKFNL